MTTQTLNAVILGASGYTGAETIRLLAHHKNVQVGAITANAQAGRTLGDLFPHLHPFADRTLVKAEDVNWDAWLLAAWGQRRNTGRVTSTRHRHRLVG
jgi:N-acetyl-gamma-glutamyl-phosphate reductase